MLPFTVGVIGTGFGSHVHVPAFSLDHRCRVKGIASRNYEKTQKQVERWNLERAYHDWQEMVQDDEIDVVSIAVPPTIQSKIIQEASVHKKHIFCEKPLAANLSDAFSAVKAVNRAGIFHAINFIFPEHEIWQKLNHLITEKSIGSIRHFAYTWRVETYASRMKAKTWKNSSKDGGSVLYNFGSHVLYNLEWLFGKVVELSHISNSIKNDIQTFANFEIFFASGHSGIVSLASDAFLGCGHRLEIFGDEGTLVLYNETADYASGFTLLMGTRKNQQFEQIAADAPKGNVDGRIKLVAKVASRFMDSLCNKVEMRPNLIDGLRIQNLIEQLKTTSFVRRTKVKGFSR